MTESRPAANLCRRSRPTSLAARLRRRWLFLVLIGRLAGLSAIVAAESSQTTLTLRDATEERLPNGIHSVIQPHGVGLGRVSVRLVVHAGSLDELENERGYAHFVEHMAFNGTRHHPPGKLIQFLQGLGLTFGPDLCANTHYDHTTYRIDLPAGRATQLLEALEVMRDFADGIEFPAGEVQRERGVVLSELAARNTADWVIDTERIKALYAGTALPRRFPAGDRAVIEAATPERLRTYYQRCYRPGRMSLVITGDVALAATRELVRRAFGSMPPGGAAPTSAALPDSPSGMRAHFIHSPATPASIVQFVALARREPNSLASRQQAHARRLVVDLLKERLIERRAQEPDRFGNAEAFVSNGPVRDFRHHGLLAGTAHRDWPAAVSLLETELRRARESGFSATEVKERIDAYLAQRRADRDAAAGLTPDLLADRIADAVAKGEAWRAPSLLVAEAEELFANFNPAKASATLHEMFADDRLRLLLYAERPPEGGEAALLTAYRESASRPLPPPSTHRSETLAFRYADFGAAGSIRHRRNDPALALTLIEFTNGVRLNIRPSAVEPARFSLAARFGRGVGDLPTDKPGLDHLAVHLIAEGWLGRHTREEVHRLLELRAVESHAGFDQQLVVSLSGPAAQLPFALQLLTARIDELKLDESRFKSALSGYAACRAARLDDAATVAHHETLLQMADGDSRLLELHVEKLGYTFADAHAAVRRMLAAELEIAVTGDFDPATIVDVAARSVGTLPARRSMPWQRALPLRIQPAHTTHRAALPDQAAAVQIAWPAPGVDTARPRWALRLAMSVLEDRLQRILRQELGATYSPDSIVIFDPTQPQASFATIRLTFEPSRAEELSRRAIAIADELSRDGPSEEEFLRLRAPFVASVEQALQSNAWWLGSVLRFAQSDPVIVDEARMLAGLVANLTRPEVHDAARILRSVSASSVTVIPESGDPNATQPQTAAEFTARGERRIAQHDSAGALEDLNRALELDPKSTGAYVNRSAARLIQGDYANAIADATKAIEIDPAIALAFCNRGAARVGTGDFTGGAADLTEALRLDPKSSEAYNNRGVARMNLGDLDGAGADWTAAIQLNPGNAKAFSNRAAMKVRRGDLDGAIADALTSLQLDPMDADTHFNLGSARHGKGMLEAALGDYNKAIELNPNVANVHGARAKLRHMRGDFGGALSDYDEAIRRNPQNSEALTNRAVLKHGRGDAAGALADFSAVITLRPDFAAAYANRAGARHAKGDLQGALADSNRAIELAPDFPDGYNNRGYTRQAAGDLDGAIADFTKAIELNPAAPLPYRNRGNVRKAKGDRLGAMDDLDRALQLETSVRAPAGSTPKETPR